MSGEAREGRKQAHEDVVHIQTEVHNQLSVLADEYTHTSHWSSIYPIPWPTSRLSFSQTLIGIG